MKLPLHAIKSLPPRTARTLRVVGVLASVGAALALALALLTAIVLAVSWQRLPAVRELLAPAAQRPLRVYADDHVLLASFGSRRDPPLPAHSIPQALRTTVRASLHDAKPPETGLRALLGALFGRSQAQEAPLVRLARGFDAQRASGTPRALYALLLARRLQRALSADARLTLYVDGADFGTDVYGFAAAAQRYFGRPLAELTESQDALLAALAAAPRVLDPRREPQGALQLRHALLQRMRARGLLDAAHAAAADAAPLGLVAEPPRLAADAAAAMVRAAVLRRWGPQALRIGAVVTTTLSAPLQRAAQNALRTALMRYTLRQPWRGPQSYLRLDARPAAWPAQAARACADDTDSLRCAVVLRASPREVQVMRDDGTLLRLRGASLQQVAALGLGAQAQPGLALRPGAVVRLWQRHDRSWVITQAPRLRGALVAIDSSSGAVRALATGFDAAAVDAVRQPRQSGAAYAPFLYSAALGKGLQPSSIVDDAPLQLDAVIGERNWNPRNADGSYAGPITLRRAFAQARNVPAVRVLGAIGAEFARRWSARFGFDASQQPPYLTLALGTGRATPLQMARAYAVVANGGFLLQPYLVAAVQRDDGRVLAAPLPQRAGDPARRTIDAANAAEVAAMLHDAARHLVGSSTTVAAFGGGTDGAHGDWFCGWRDGLVTVAWVGYLNGLRLSGPDPHPARALWQDFMRSAQATTARAAAAADPRSAAPP